MSCCNHHQPKKPGESGPGKFQIYLLIAVGLLVVGSYLWSTISHLGTP